MKIIYTVKNGDKKVGGVHVHYSVGGTGLDFMAESDGEGYAEVIVPADVVKFPHNAKVYIEHPGYVMPTIYIDYVQDQDREVPITLVPFVEGESPVPPANVAWPIHRDGLVLREADGKIFRWLGLTAFQLYLFWLQDRKDAIDAAVNNWLTVCPGVTVLRVLGMVTSFAHLYPQEHPDYYDQLRPFADYIRDKWGVGIEFVVFADANFVMPDRGDRNRHRDRVLTSFAGATNVFFEACNEPNKDDWNMPGGNQEAHEHAVALSGHGILCTSGAGSEEAIHAGHAGPDYVTIHPPRTDDWYRKLKDVLDVRDQTGLPCCADEPIGIAENDKPGSRTTNADECGTAGAVAQAHGLGSTIHGDFGIDCVPFGPKQTECAKRWHDAAMWVPAEAQLAPFVRGSADSPCGWAYGEGPAEHLDDIDMRSYCKHGGFGHYLIQCHVPGKPYRDHISPCSGWAIEELGPSAGMARMKQA